MSVAYNKRKKAIKRQLDQANPERPRIRRMIRKGLLPRWFFLKINFQRKSGEARQGPTFGRAYSLTHEEKGLLPGTMKKIKTIFLTRGTLALRSTFRQLTSEGSKQT
jgi:hypothetical protein